MSETRLNRLYFFKITSKKGFGSQQDGVACTEKISFLRTTFYLQKDLPGMTPGPIVCSLHVTFCLCVGFLWLLRLSRTVTQKLYLEIKICILN